MRILASGKRDSVAGEEVVTHTVIRRGGGGEGAYSFTGVEGIVPGGNFDKAATATSTRQNCELVNTHSSGLPVKDSCGGKFYKQYYLGSSSADSESRRDGVGWWRKFVCKGLSFFASLSCTKQVSNSCLLKTSPVVKPEESCYTLPDVDKNLNTNNVDTVVSSQDTECYTRSQQQQLLKCAGHDSINPENSIVGDKSPFETEPVNFVKDIICDCCERNSAQSQTTLPASSLNVIVDTCKDSSSLLPDTCELVASGIVGIGNCEIMKGGIYHEKQIKSLCALHALNNLLQDGKAFKQEDLDKICSELDPNSWVNPHKSVFGLGNYDINVIMTALQQKHLEAIWFDKRKDPSEELNFDNIYGFILNIPSDCRLGWLALPIKRKHWVAIRNLPSITERDAGRSNYYNLDSKFDKPESIGTADNLIEYLRGELKSPEKELFLVVTEDVGKVETWRKNPPSLTSAASSGGTHLLPVPSSGEGSSSFSDASAGSGTNRRTSNDSGVVDLLPDLKDINVVDLNKEDLMRRQSSGVWSDLT